jgi:hypothetical protein
MSYSVYMLPQKNCETCLYHGKSLGLGVGGWFT